MLTQSISDLPVITVIIKKKKMLTSSFALKKYLTSCMEVWNCQKEEEKKECKCQIFFFFILFFILVIIDSYLCWI